MSLIVARCECGDAFLGWEDEPWDRAMKLVWCPTCAEAKNMAAWREFGFSAVAGWPRLSAVAGWPRLSAVAGWPRLEAAR